MENDDMFQIELTRRDLEKAFHSAWGKELAGAEVKAVLLSSEDGPRWLFDVFSAGVHMASHLATPEEARSPALMMVKLMSQMKAPLAF